VVAAVVVSLIGFVEAMVGRNTILFFYQPPDSFWQPHVIRGTFVNPNHLGALLCVAAPAALVLGLAPEAVGRARLVWGAAALVLNLTAMLTFKRGTIAVVLFGDAVAIVLALGRGAGRRQMAALGLALAGLIGGLVISGAAVMSEVSATGAELADPRSRPQLWRDSLALSFEHPWTGVGRGAFEPAITRTSTAAGQIRYRHAENEYLQAAVDLGWPAALGLLALAVWAARLAFKRAREETLAAAALAGIAALAVHQAFDFAVELPGVALPALAVLATLFGESSRESTPGRRRFYVAAWTLVLPLALVGATAVHLRTPSLDDDRAELTALASDPSAPIDAVLARAETLRARHPADYYLLALVAERLVRDGDLRALRWLNHALYLNPRHPALHVMAAEVLAATGRKSQALLEYRLAAESARDPRTQVWERVLKRYPAVDDLIAATPKTASHLALMGKWLVSQQRRDDADRLYGMALALEPQRATWLTAWTRLAVDRGDLTQARARLARLVAEDGGLATRQLRVRVELIAGDLAAAERLADAEPERTSAVLETELQLAAALIQARELTRARARLDRLTAWSLDRDSAVRLHEQRAALEQAAGNEHQRRWELEQRDRLLRAREP